MYELGFSNLGESISGEYSKRKWYDVKRLEDVRTRWKRFGNKNMM